VKLLLYLLIGAGFGELDAEDVTTLSVPRIPGGPPLNDAGIPAVKEERLRACVKALIPEGRGRD
jgi:hypothetical protein